MPGKIFIIKRFFYPELQVPLDGRGTISITLDELGAVSVELIYSISRDNFKLIETLERYSEIITEKNLKKLKSSRKPNISLKFQPTITLFDKIKKKGTKISLSDLAIFEQAPNWILIDILFEID
ncbi:MAG: hypothetical protein ACXAC7_14865 [Candidatus Hodarchaeales archaeon]|jgi:hypothetical protein